MPPLRPTIETSQRRLEIGCNEAGDAPDVAVPVILMRIILLQRELGQTKRVGLSAT
jgi:hypothetical protein